MLLSEIFEYLTFGELSHLSIGGIDAGTIDVGDYPRIIANVNLGMIELHKRFNLKVREVPLQLYDQITMYNLHTDYAESNTESLQPIKYITDGALVHPFSDDILLITHVYNEIGEELPLNDLDEDYSVFTPTPITLQVPDSSNENALAIVYRAQPVKIPMDTADATSVEIELPDQFTEALLAYVAWRIFAPLNVGERAEANSYYAKFESAVALIKDLGMLNIDNNANQKFGDNGWL